MAEKVYFPNLHGFRFFAAALVMLSHIELFKRRIGLKNFWDTPFFFEAGGAGVDFFFVLSGFLITTLLLKELANTNSIAIRKFYMRRILRIWPLYYLIIVLCYFILPYLSAFYIPGYSEGIHENFREKLIYSIFFMPNAALAFFGNIPYAAPIWSVGVEEQFYVFWPLLLLLFTKRVQTILFFIVAFIGIKIVLILSNTLYAIDVNIFTKVKDLVVATRMECMGIGGLGAWLINKKHKAGDILKSNTTLAIALLLFPVIILFAKNLFELHHIFFSILFLIVIINGAANSKTPIKLENKLFIMLGNISYGLYLWHSICIGFLINLLRNHQFFKSNEGWFNLALYAGTFLLSTLIAWSSFTYFETPFLKLKSRFSVIVSGTEARNSKTNSTAREN